mgnify:CR=1 FL=1
MSNANRIKEGKLDAELLREQLSYDLVTGFFIWNEDRGNPQARSGMQAGTVLATGYRVIRVGGYRYLAHRLAWFYVHGIWPQGEIDHVNFQKDDNRLSNLRDVSRTKNVWNCRKIDPQQYRTGFLVRLIRNGRTVIRKQFPTKRLASLARDIALGQFNALNGHVGA